MSGFRGYTVGELRDLPVGTLLEEKKGQFHAYLGGEWWIRIPGPDEIFAPFETREIFGLFRQVPDPGGFVLWNLLKDRGIPRVRHDGSVEIDILLPSKLRAHMEKALLAEDAADFVARVLRGARKFPGSLGAVREDQPSIGEGPGFVRVTLPPVVRRPSPFAGMKGPR